MNVGNDLINPEQFWGSLCVLQTLHLQKFHSQLRKVEAIGGSWYLFTNLNCTYNPLISPLSALIWL